MNSKRLLGSNACMLERANKIDSLQLHDLLDWYSSKDTGHGYKSSRQESVWVVKYSYENDPKVKKTMWCPLCAFLLVKIYSRSVHSDDPPEDMGMVRWIVMQYVIFFLGTGIPIPRWPSDMVLLVTVETVKYFLFISVAPRFWLKKQH